MKSRVLVDADACPVRREIARAAERYGIEALFFANSSQEAAELLEPADGARGRPARCGRFRHRDAMPRRATSW